MKYRVYYPTALFCFVLASSVLVSACESQLDASLDDLTVQAQNAVDVLPANPDFVGMLNTKDLKENEQTDLFGKNGLIRPDLPQDMIARFEDFVEMTGFDPAEDLNEVYMAVESAMNDGRAQVSIVAYASIDPARLKAYVEDQAGSELRLRTYRGADVYEADSDDEAPGVSFLNNDMIVAASNAGALNAMIDRLQGQGGALNSNDKMMNLVAHASAGKSGWMVAKKPGDASMHAGERGNDMQETAEQIWAAVDHLVVATNVEPDGLDNQVLLFPNAGVSADDVSSLVKGMIAVLKANPELDDEKLDALDDIEVRSAGDYVRIGLFVDNEMIAMVKR